MPKRTSSPSKPKSAPLPKAAAAAPTGGRAMVNVFDGTRKLYSDKAQVLLTARDGNQTVWLSRFFEKPSVLLVGLPLFNNFGDNYAILASADGYIGAGFFPVKLSAGVTQSVDLMLIPKDGHLNFANATWDALDQSRPNLKKLLTSGAADNDAAAQRYGEIIENNGGEVLACLLNITTVMGQIQLPQGTPFDYLKSVIWDSKGGFPMANDRFFAWADPKLIDQVERAKAQSPAKFENAPFGLHPGATRSYKEIEYGEANLQLTLHENDKKRVDDVDCVMVELDIDYYKSTAAHLLLEVGPNALGSMTEPKAVYALRWIAGQRAGVPEFDPLYTIEKA